MLPKINKKAHRHNGHEYDEEPFEFPNPEIVNRQEGESVDEGHQAPKPQGEAEEDLKGDSRADDFLEVITNDGQFDQYPQDHGDGVAVVLLGRREKGREGGREGER